MINTGRCIPVARPFPTDFSCRGDIAFMFLSLVAVKTYHHGHRVWSSDASDSMEINRSHKKEQSCK